MANPISPYGRSITHRGCPASELSPHSIQPQQQILLVRPCTPRLVSPIPLRQPRRPAAQPRQRRQTAVVAPGTQRDDAARQPDGMRGPRDAKQCHDAREPAPVSAAELDEGGKAQRERGRLDEVGVRARREVQVVGVERRGKGAVAVQRLGAQARAHDEEGEEGGAKGDGEGEGGCYGWMRGQWTSVGGLAKGKAIEMGAERMEVRDVLGVGED